ncbi:MAG TPA: hypothetical protein PLZ51_07465, partial [Aggregatilineales bacterium]|nr:hypothetical protein [Aggregatilineales bacterium]
MFNNTSCTSTSTPPPTATQPPATATQPPSAQVRLYSVSNFGGSVVFSGGTGFSNAPGGTSYSLQIPSGWSARTWKGDNQGGEGRCWSSSVTNLQDHGWQNSIESIMVYNYNDCPPPPTEVPVQDVLVCRNDDGSDCGALNSTGIWDFGGNPDWNDRIRAVGVPSGKSIFVFQNDRLRGTGECYSSNRVPLPNSDPWNLRGTVTSIQVFDQTGCPNAQLRTVVLYDGQNFGSHHWGMGYDAGAFDIDGGDSYKNDRAESIRIPNGMSVIL